VIDKRDGTVGHLGAVAFAQEEGRSPLRHGRRPTEFHQGPALRSLRLRRQLREQPAGSGGRDARVHAALLTRLRAAYGPAPSGRTKTSSGRPPSPTRPRPRPPTPTPARASRSPSATP
jgi:hypothetical protein